jgi:hypothetical protein
MFVVGGVKLALNKLKRKNREEADPESVRRAAMLSDAMYGGSALKKKKINDADPEFMKQYRLDRRLSNDHQHVYVNKKEKKVITAYRGTSKKDMSNDLFTDAAIAIGFESKTGRFKKAVSSFERIASKYDGYHHTLTGHSLGGSIARHVRASEFGDIVDEVHMFNPGSGLGNYFGRSGTEEGVHGHYIAGDPISMLGWGGETNTHVYKPSGANVHTIENFI